MKSPAFVPLFSLLILGSPLLTGCASPPPPVDLAAAKAALMDADQAWSRTPPDPNAFVSFVAQGAHFLAPEGPAAVGKESIRQTIGPMFSAPGLVLKWKASDANVSASGDLGYTIGTFTLSMDDADGNPVSREGKYVTIWRKQEDGSWKVEVDAPNFNSPLPAPQPPDAG